MKPKVLLLVPAAISLNIALWVYLHQKIPGIYEENGLMENFQAACLLLGFFAFARQAAGFTGVEKIFFTAGALFVGTILVLEVDFRKLDAPLLNKVFNGTVRNIWLGGLWACVLALVFKNIRPIWFLFRSWATHQSGIFMWCAKAFWILSGLIDKELLGAKDLFREELMEVNAAPLMAVSAFAA